MIFLATIALAFSPVVTNAAIVYRVGVEVQSTAVIGETFTAKIYLDELTNGDTPVLGLAGKGINSADFLIERGVGQTSVNVVVAPDAVIGNLNVLGTLINTSTQGGIAQTSNVELLGTPNGVNAFRLYVGEVKLIAVALGLTTFTPKDFDLGTPSMTLFDPTLPDPFIIDLDPQLNAGLGGNGYVGASITVLDAPEPTTMSALAAFGAIGGACSYFRRKRKATAA